MKMLATPKHEARHERERRSTVILLAAAAIVVLAILVPSASGAVTAGERQSATSLRVAYATAAQADFYYAMRTNLWKRFGLQVRGIPFANGTDLVTALVAGSVDVGFLGMPPVIGSNAVGAGIRVFRVGLDVGAMDSLYVSRDSGIAKLSDLVGKTVATTRGSQSDILLHYALSRAGIPASNVNIVYFAPPALVAGYARGDFKAVWTFSTPGAQLLALGARMVTTAHQIGMSDPASYAAKQITIDSKRAALVSFSRALDAAAKVTANKDVWVRSVSRGSGLTIDQAYIAARYLLGATPSSKLLMDRKYRLSLVRDGGWAQLAQKEAVTMTEMGLLRNAPPPVSTMYTSSIAGAAVAANARAASK